ncbi:hypothetical protein [Streptomyces sp. NBC_01716]|uniref:hypothetical protein n=1 Tax=Streptomyces sp. NBC_01716 TaxID=2975917 RepID=UPI002E346BB7|nr:hypothetical protein [Streptomyces sp. NBC_01716]
MTTDARSVLTAFAQAARTAHPALTTLDQLSGDGDFGDNLREGLDLVAGALGIALLFWCRARVAGDAPGEPADHLPDTDARRR